MAILKHKSIKNSNYDDAYDYLTMQHDEFSMKPILDENGRQLPREDYLIDGILCDPETFGKECEAVNFRFGKNQTYDEIKAHQYIISFDPRDKSENGLTVEMAQSFAIEFAKKNFPGHQAIVCTHSDGHNSAGNIHTHIVINSLRAKDVERKEFMERPADSKAGNKHHLTRSLLMYLKQETMTMCQEKSLYQVDLLSPAKVKITEREYWAKLRGQAKLDKENASKSINGEPIEKNVFLTEKDFLREVISTTISDSGSMEEFKNKLFSKYGIIVNESRGRINYTLPDKEKPIRGRALGTDYEKESLEKIMLRRSAAMHTNIGLVADISKIVKAQENQYYARKVKTTNLKQMAASLAFLQDNNINSLEELDALADAVSADYKKIHSTLKSTEARLSKVNMLIKNTGQYLSNKDIYSRYLASKNKAAFRESHRTEISLYEAARKALKSEYGDKKIPTIKKLKEEKQSLIQAKNSQYEEYSETLSRHRELQNIRHNIREALDIRPQTRGKEKGVSIQI